jgi:crotonobetainyl-CoA:carnitine CoA-transferase CaiB-like acyl-CoA transferase
MPDDTQPEIPPSARETLPLSGIRVLDLSRVLAGPVCCQVLGDLGADVVKVERPGKGDDTRQWGPPFLGNDDDDQGNAGPSAYYLSCNRNKRGIALDLEQPAAREVLDDLIRRADVLVENFLPAALAKFGLEPARLRALNPNLVAVSISGFGRTGPLADAPGYDLAIQATAGLMSITGEVDGAPMKVGVAISDVLTGLYAAISALAGLQARSRGTAGQHFDLALADCTLASLVNVAQSTLVTGQRPKRYGNAHPQIVPYEAFATADGHLVLAVGNDRQWQRFCQAAGGDDLADDNRFATNPLRVQHRGELIPELQKVFKLRTTAVWLALLTDAEVPHAPVVPINEALTTPQSEARGVVQTVTDSEGRRYRLVASPIHIAGAGPFPVTAPPELGEHTDEVLREWLGLAEARVAELHSQGAIA